MGININLMAVAIIRILGVILSTVVLSHVLPSPWWILGGAALACLFLP